MLISRLLKPNNQDIAMPISKAGDITTSTTVDVKTLQDVIVDDKKDVIPIKIGGMARTPQDTGAGIELGGGGPAYVLPAATTDAIGGVKKTPTIAALAGGADAAAIVTTVNDLIAKLKTAGIVT